MTTAKDITHSETMKLPFEVKPEDMRVKPEDWELLEKAIWNLSSHQGLFGMDFLGSLLQCLHIDFSFEVPSACIYYNAKRRQYMMMINPVFFRAWSPDGRSGLLLHELKHMISMHISRFAFLESKEKANIAADAAVNQGIPGLPGPGEWGYGIHHQDFGMPADKSMEDYYDLLPEQSSEDDQEGDGEGGEDGEGGGKGKSKGQGKPRGVVMDAHNWDPNVDEGEAQDALEDVIKRTMIKTSTDHTRLPQWAKDTLEQIEKSRQTLNWKNLLRMFLKRTAFGVSRESTRTRPNKRYGYRCPGLKNGPAPNVLFLVDTSGSMSIEEVNAGLDEADKILKVGTRNVKIGLWHTDLYFTGKYSKGKREYTHSVVQSGGTDFESCAQYIQQHKPDAVVVFTDGCFENTSTKVDCPILFIISAGGVDKPPTTYPYQKLVKIAT
jgi:predicted metal-dependent peptidase